MGQGKQRRHKVRRLGLQVCRCNRWQAHQSSVLCDVQSGFGLRPGRGTLRKQQPDPQFDFR